VLLALLALAAAGLVAVWAARQLERRRLAAERQAELARARDVERVVLVTLDAVRADHLGCYGYPRATSPFVDGLARRGALFTRAFATMATTAPSHASLFTSLYPSQHQLLKNGHRLDDAWLTLAEQLRAAGFDTAGFVGTSVHFRAGNLDQGFAFFDEPPAGQRTRIADRTLAAVLEWLPRRASDRFLLWVHLFDAHQPYEPPRAFRESFGEAKGRKQRAGFLQKRQRLGLEIFGGDPERLLYTVDNYDGEIAFADSQLRRLSEALEAQGLGARTLWIVTSDHGEGLGAHRWLEHGRNLYNEQLRVPLVLAFPGGAFAGRRLDDVVEHVDLLPTLAALLGLESPASPAPRQGLSLLPLLTGSGERKAPGRLLPPGFAWAERRRFDEAPASPDAIGAANYEPGEKFALQDAAYKYIYWSDGPGELYDLRADPFELADLAGSRPALEARFKSAILAALGAMQREARFGPQAVDPAVVEGLRSLGYVQ
jgi:arylsulfatase A-like enzyme